MALVLLAFKGYTSPPTWWTDAATQIIDPSSARNNYGPANVGQLKHVASQASKHLDDTLAGIGGAGSEIDDLIESFQLNPQSDGANYSPINLGQLKAVGKLFYDRLLALNYLTRQSLIAHGYPSNWSSNYPWDPTQPSDSNYQPANIGQLKMVFSFELRADVDDDNLPDWWELVQFGGQGETASDDHDGDGVTNGEELNNGLDPLVQDNPLVQFTASAFAFP